MPCWPRSTSVENVETSPRIFTALPMSPLLMPSQSVAQYTIPFVEAIFATCEFSTSPWLPSKPWP